MGDAVSHEDKVKSPLERRILNLVPIVSTLLPQDDNERRKILRGESGDVDIPSPRGALCGHYSGSITTERHGVAKNIVVVLLNHHTFEIIQKLKTGTLETTSKAVVNAPANQVMGLATE